MGRSLRKSQNEEKTSLLKETFGYDSFRPGQEELIDAILAGQDVVGVMPTGGGKSICYQLPALMMPGITLVISPLISLMIDQVQALVQLGVPGAYLNSALNQKQLSRALDNACQGRYKIIYLAPERLKSAGIRRLTECQPVSMICVDEAHCVSQWGPDFRPSYLEIPEFLHTLPVRPVVAAFTATATPRVRRDLVEKLELKNPHSVVTSFDRPNLYFQVQEPKDKFEALRTFLFQHRGQSGIIYCLTRKEVENVHERLCETGYDSVRYHAGLELEERNQSQDEFISGRKKLIVATNAFGMGIDKSDVDFVVHYSMPRDLESYYQEAGRAGRDGRPAECLLLYSERDVQINQFMIDRAPDKEDVDDKTRTFLRNQENLRLAHMKRYATTGECLGNALLAYFGEIRTEPCGHCANCHAELMAQRIAEKQAVLQPRISQREEALFSALYEERAKQGRRNGVKPANIFSDSTLREMARKRPANTFQLLQVSGVTLTKCRKYGTAFLRVINEKK